MADRRFTAPDGGVWASEFEYQVYEAFRVLGYDVRKCGEGDSFDYSSTIRGGQCLECGSVEVRQRRTYTPDLLVRDFPGEHGPEPRFIEAKGYWPAPKRNLLRSAVKENESLNPVFVFQVDRKATGTTTYSAYVQKFFPGCRVALYNWTRSIKTEKTLQQKLQEFQASILAFSGDGKK